MKGSYIFRYERDGEVLGYYVDTFCNYGPREFAKMYCGVHGDIKANEIQNTIQWHIELGSEGLKGITVVPEKITRDEDVPERYTII